MSIDARRRCASSEPGSRLGGLCGAEEQARDRTSTRSQDRFITVSIGPREVHDKRLKKDTALSRGCGPPSQLRRTARASPDGGSEADPEAQQLGSQSPQVDVRPVRTRKETQNRRPADAHAGELGGRRGMELVELPCREKFFVGGTVVALEAEHFAEIDPADRIRRA